MLQSRIRNYDAQLEELKSNHESSLERLSRNSSPTSIGKSSSAIKLKQVKPKGPALQEIEEQAA